MRKPIKPSSNARGVTLVELIISMLIISIALAGILSVMNFTTGRSADPMIQHQAIAIAEAYMEEILLQGYDDLDEYEPEGIPELNGYEVTVTVQGPPTIMLNAIEAKKITVTVTHDAMGNIDLVGYRTGY